MKLFKRRKLTPEELEEKARREQEWAQRCYEAGERFGNKIDLQGKIDKINTFGNTYPKTFFSIIFGSIIFCMIMNLLFVNKGSFLRHTGRDLNNAVATQDDSKAKLNQGIDKVFQEYIALNHLLEELIVKEPKTREDSIQVVNICERLETLQSIIDGEPTMGQPQTDMEQELGELEQSIERIKGKGLISLEDSLELRSLEARKSFVEEIVEEGGE